MSVVEWAEQGTSDSPDIKANDEERYRLKIAVLQEYYDAVALQTLRIRERIYQVRKQCRRLEAMKRVALNMLHQNTGTYEIPPLEIIDEDPAPSFLESVHRQLHTPPETPRKKSKRPSRRKAGGKLTPEEEERAKQKICSIIDSVYSETAKRMGDTPKRPMRSVNVTGALSQCDIQKKPRRLLNIEPESEEGSKKTGSSKTATQQTSDYDSQSRSGTRFNEHPEAYIEETATEKPSTDAYGEANSDASIELTFNSLPPKLHMRFHPVEGTSSSITCHDMAPSLYRQGTDKVQSYGADPVNAVYETSLNANQRVEYIDGDVTQESTIGNTGLPINCTLLQGAAESSAIYANAAKCTNTSATVSCNENLNPAAGVDHTEITSVTPVSAPVFTPAEPTSCSDKAIERNEASKSLVGFCDRKETAGPAVVNKAIPAMSTEEGKASPNKNFCKQKAPSKALNKGLPPPNFIPYRMIAVENAKLLELATNASSSGKPSLPKPSPKRRRKYKYVVESVLDNVPYTFRQTESDDDEYTEKNSLSANRSHN